MAKYISNRFRDLNVGINSYSENTTSLQVDGKVGIGTTSAGSYELFVEGDANISGIVSATAFYGSGVNLTDLVNTISVSKIEGIFVENNSVAIGTAATTINFDSGLNATYGSGIVTVTSSGAVGITSIQISHDNINIGTGSSTINFTGTGIQTVTSSPSGITTVRVDLQGNLDGGLPDSNYGGIEAIEGGGI